jgi:hypothetical protein
MMNLKKTIRSKSTLTLPGVDAQERDQVPWLALRDDLWLLQRLVYKNRNQHRTAAFFHRVQHVQRSQTAFWQSPVVDQTLRSLFVALPNGAKRNAKCVLRCNTH